jgi:hypothetical protein
MKKMKTDEAKIKVFKPQGSVRYLTQKNNNGEALILWKYLQTQTMKLMNHQQNCKTINHQKIQQRLKSLNPRNYQNEEKRDWGGRESDLLGFAVCTRHFAGRGWLS